mmetsp:Transcript_63054/g.117994  ORF Transcript_63054/g.117994 Transcript_63054/m.117994 type:complete len:211 (+) Transcript_63054:1135-1767(+)
MLHLLGVEEVAADVQHQAPPGKRRLVPDLDQGKLPGSSLLAQQLPQRHQAVEEAVLCVGIQEHPLVCHVEDVALSAKALRNEPKAQKRGLPRRRGHLPNHGPQELFQGLSKRLGRHLSRELLHGKSARAPGDGLRLRYQRRRVVQALLHLDEGGGGHVAGRAVPGKRLRRAGFAAGPGAWRNQRQGKGDGQPPAGHGCHRNMDSAIRWSS